MAESKQRVRKLSGAVLIMVVTIMTVLIIMLMATLTVVANVNKRTITKFEENQAYYTARSTVEVYIDEFLEGNDKTTGSYNSIITAWKNIGGTGYTSYKFSFNESDSTDTVSKTYLDNLKANKYMTGSADADGNDQITDGYVHQQEIFAYLTPKYTLDDSVINSTNGTIPSNVKSDENWVEYSPTGTQKDNYFVEFEASLPDISNKTTDSSGKDNVGVLDSDGKVTVRVELLRVVYQTTNGTLLYDGNADHVKNLDDSNHEANLLTSDGKIKMSAIDWDKTYYRLKVSATSSIENGSGGYNESTVSVLLEANPVPAAPKGPENAMTTFASTEADNKIGVVGGSSLSKPGGTTEFNNSETSLVGSGVYNSNFRMTASHDQWAYGAGEYLIIHGGWLSDNNADFKITGYGKLNETDPTELAKRPFIYAQGAKFFKTNVGGSDTSAIDIYCGKPLTSNTDILFKDEAGLSYANVPDDHKDTVSFVTSQSDNKFYGDIYVDGDMYLSANSDQFYGNIYCTGNIYITNANSGQCPKFHGSVSCANILTYGWDSSTNSNTWMVPTDTSTFFDGGSYTGSASTFSLDWDESAYNSDGEMVFTGLPGNRSELTCSSEKQVENAYSYKTLKMSVPTGTDATVNVAEKDKEGKNVQTGPNSWDTSWVETRKTHTETLTEDSPVRAVDYLNYTMQSTNSTLAVKSNAKNLADDMKVTNWLGGMKTISDDYGTYYGIVLTPGSVTNDAGYAQCYIDMNSLNLNNLTGRYYIDATSTPMQIELRNFEQNSTPTFIVVGNNAVIFTVDDGKNFSAKSMSVYSSEIWAMTHDSDWPTAVTNVAKQKLYVGSEPAQANLPKAPNIYYVIGDGSGFEIRNGGNGNVFCGYMYGSYAILQFDSSSDGIEADLNYNGTDLGSLRTCTFFGSVTFNSISFQQMQRLIYIASGGSSGGGSSAGGLVTWGRMRYYNG